MDIDRFVVRNGVMWNRLDELAERARKSKGRLQPHEVDELVALYQRTAAQLSYARAYYDDPGLTSRLTMLVAKSSASIYGTRGRVGQTLRRFLAETFPAAVYGSRRFIAVAAALLLVPMFAVGIWFANSDEALDLTIPKEDRAALVQDAQDYYSESPAQEFSTRVLVNNIQVSFFAFALGITLVGTVYILLTNAVNVGALVGLFFHEGLGPQFLGLLAPHGLLELTAIVIASAAGLRLGWAIVAPGDRPRREALAEEGRRSVAVVLGLMICFVVAGIIEAFVTPSGLPTSARVGAGVVVELGFITWVVSRGRVAAAAGLTGRFDEPPLAELLQSRPVALSLR
jgi:uncharacterized membrane protein SpoIIM required for sporulation